MGFYHKIFVVLFILAGFGWALINANSYPMVVEYANGTNKKEIADLVAFLNYHSDLYYNQDNPEISDDEWDMGYKRLKNLEEEYPALNIAHIKIKNYFSFFAVF